MLNVCNHNIILPKYFEKVKKKGVPYRCPRMGGRGKGNIFFGGAFRKAKYEKLRRRKSEGGQKFLVDVHSPTPFLFARPSENYQKSASGFSSKKVRILTKRHCQLESERQSLKFMI